MSSELKTDGVRINNEQAQELVDVVHLNMFRMLIDSTSHLSDAQAQLIRNRVLGRLVADFVTPIGAAFQRRIKELELAAVYGGLKNDRDQGTGE